MVESKEILYEKEPSTAERNIVEEQCNLVNEIKMKTLTRLHHYFHNKGIAIPDIFEFLKNPEYPGNKEKGPKLIIKALLNEIIGAHYSKIQAADFTIKKCYELVFASLFSKNREDFDKDLPRQPHFLESKGKDTVSKDRLEESDIDINFTQKWKQGVGPNSSSEQKETKKIKLKRRVKAKLTQIKNYNSKTSRTPRYSSKIEKSENKRIVLDNLLRNYPIVSKKGLMSALTLRKYMGIVLNTDIELPEVQEIITQFLLSVKNLNDFLNKYKIKWPHDVTELSRKVRIYLHKIHRIAPVFDYSRARRNLEILHTSLAQRSFWPQISTQIALIIYVTDLNNGKTPKLLQKNIRILCNSSAYAFHRTRKILGISEKKKESECLLEGDVN